MQAGIGHQGSPQASRPDNHGIMFLKESQKVLKPALKRRHLIADTSLAFYVKERQVLGYLRGINTKFL